MIETREVTPQEDAFLDRTAAAMASLPARLDAVDPGWRGSDRPRRPSAGANQAFVRKLMAEREPEYAALLAQVAAEIEGSLR